MQVLLYSFVYLLFLMIIVILVDLFHIHVSRD